MKEMKEIECALCGKVFRTQSDFYSHRKKQHKETIPSCKNYKTGACIYGKDMCWFLHENVETGEDTEIKDGNIIQKMMQMMERMTERMINLEESNKKLQDSLH